MSFFSLHFYRLSYFLTSSCIHKNFFKSALPFPCFLTNSNGNSRVSLNAPKSSLKPAHRVTTDDDRKEAERSL